MIHRSAPEHGPALDFGQIAGSVDSIGACSECCLPLDLAFPSVSQPARAWLCGECGSAYFARRDEVSSQSQFKGARAVHHECVFQAAELDDYCLWHRGHLSDLRRVLRFLSSFEHTGFEQRRETRHAVALRVLALPLGHNFRVIGEAVQMTMINISRAGAALLDPNPVKAPYLAIDFSVAGPNNVQAILDVLRVRSLFAAYETAGQWRCRIVPHGRGK